MFESVRVVPPLFTVIAPLTFKFAFEELFVMAVTFDPTAPEIEVETPLPELVIVPALLIAAVESVIPELTELLLLTILKLPEPVTPPESVRVPVLLELLFVMVVPPLFSAMPVPLMLKGEAALALSVMAETLEPTPEVIVTDPVPVPELVSVPELLTAVVVIVRPPAVEPLLLRVKLPVPVIPLLSVKTAAPESSVRIMLPLPIVKAPV